MAQQQPTRQPPQRPRHESSGFAVGMTALAAVVSMMAGAWEIMLGLVALFNDEFLVATRKWVFQFDLTTWAWIHLLVGLLLVVAGGALFSGALWARIVIIVAAALTAVAEFAAMPYYPLWSLTVIAACVLVIWALVAHGRDITTGV